MRTVEKITLWQGQQILKLELDKLNEPWRKDDVRSWKFQEYLWIKNRVMDLFNNSSPLIFPKDVLKTTKRKYKINYDVFSYSETEIDQLSEACSDWLKFIHNLHFIVAAISSPVPEHWLRVSTQREFTLDEMASDILNAKFIDAFAIVMAWYNSIEKISWPYRIKRLKDKVSGKPEPVKLIDSVHGMFVINENGIL